MTLPSTTRGPEGRRRSEGYHTGVLANNPSLKYTQTVRGPDRATEKYVYV